MKEVTYEDWKKNPTPRMMWVWANDEERKEKLKVIYILSEEEAPVSNYRVITLIAGHDYVVRRYTHCAEIEEPRRMTNKELSRWLREKPTREMRYNFDEHTYCYYTYVESDCDEEVNGILIREDDGEWREPLVEQE